MSPGLRVSWSTGGCTISGTVISVAPPSEHTRGCFILLILQDDGRFTTRDAEMCRAEPWSR